MCFTKEVSILTYIVGLVGCLNLYFNLNLKIEAVFFAWVVQMQLIEYFLWDNQECNNVNKNTTKIGTIVNHLEPIILWISILLFATQKIPEFVNPIMIFFIIATIVYTGYVINDNCTLVTPESSPHLYWSWNNDNKYSGIYYSFFIIVLNILAISSMEFGFHFASILTGGYVLSYAIYNNYKSVGSMWCFFAAFAPWIIPFIYKINLD